MTCRYCDAAETRPYMNGDVCQSHTPAAIAGRPEDAPDPTMTLDGLRAAKGLTYVFRAVDSALNDQRAIASGRRRSTPEQYRAARLAEQERKGKR